MGTEDSNNCGLANCGCWYHAEEGVPCEHDIAEAERRGLTVGKQPMQTSDIISYLRSTEKRLMIASLREKREFQHELIEEERKAIGEACELLSTLPASYKADLYADEDAARDMRLDEE